MSKNRGNPNLGYPDVKGQIMGKKVFSVRLPVEFEEILSKMSKCDRTMLIRKAIIKEIKAQ